MEIILAETGCLVAAFTGISKYKAKNHEAKYVSTIRERSYDVLAALKCAVYLIVTRGLMLLVGSRNRYLAQYRLSLKA